MKQLKKHPYSFYPWVLIICFLLLDQARGEPPSEEIDIHDSLFLLKNILKDVSKEKEIKEQYMLLIRAESIFKRIRKSLSNNESGELRKQILRTFKKLPLPAEVKSYANLTFKLKRGVKNHFYWSDPVTEEMLVDYLNSSKTTQNDFSKQVLSHSATIRYDKKLSRFITKSSDQPILGANYYLAKEFSLWFAKASQVSISLPTQKMVEALEEPGFSCWSKTEWKDKDESRVESWEMFGGEFFSLFLKGTAVGELPDARYPDVQIRLVSSLLTGKKLYLRMLRSEK